MSLRLLPDGRPGEDLGIGHTLKHYLSPTEMWEDVAQDVALHLRPRAVADAWSGVRLWEVAQDPSAPVRDGWERLRAVYRDGYGALVQEAMTRLGEPTERLRLARLQDDRLVPLCQAWLADADWFDSDIQVRKRDLPEPTLEQQKLIDSAEVDMPDRGRWTRTVVVAIQRDGTWRGQGIAYSQDAGLQFQGARMRT